MVTASSPRRFDVVLVRLDPTVGHEIRKTRPCVVVSPDEMNAHMWTLLVAPLTSATKRYPMRVDCRFDGKPGQVVLDQVRAIDLKRVSKRVGKLDPRTGTRILQVLQEMFAP